jgi:ceramide glucosyltransferase
VVIAMITLHTVLTALVACSWIYYALAMVAALRWRRSARAIEQAEPPPVSILKPLRGADPEQEASFGTFLQLDYPRYQVVFGALDSTDSALETARCVQRDYTGVDVAIAVGGEVYGLNRKACNLDNMLREAKHDLLVLCDSDMHVEPDYLRRVTAPFADPTVGLVTCLYRGYKPRGTAAALEALGIGADFAPSVLVANMTEGMSFAFGSTIALRTETLARIGGFRVLADYIADDYLLGRRVRDLDLRVVLSDYVVDDVIGCTSFRDMWTRRVRWARTVRAMRPSGYTGSGITHGVVLALLLAISFGGSGWGIAALAATLVWRAIAALFVCRCTRDTNVMRSLHLLPLSDLVGLAVWVAGLLGRSVEWRGERFRVGRDGRLEAR